MKIPQFKVVPGRYTQIKFYDNEVRNLIKALQYYQGDFPQNSWSRDIIKYLEQQEFVNVKLNDHTVQEP